MKFSAKSVDWSRKTRNDEICDFGLRPSETGFALHWAGIADLGKAKGKGLGAPVKWSSNLTG